MQAGRYVVLALVLGGLCVWGSENFFWIMPPPGLTVADFLLTVVAYAMAAAVALSAVIWARLGGMAGAFLGGALVGYLSEGVLVGTIYQAVPFQLVWTPLAWHALITGAVVLGVGRAGLSVAARLAVWVTLGLAGAYWAQFWVSERASLPEVWRLAVYLLALGLLVPLAHAVMDRLEHLPRPRPWVLWVAPVIAGLVWLAQGVADPDPVRLVLPLILALILWAMRRLGRPGAVSLGPAVPLWQHLLFLIAPAIVVVLAPIGWAQHWGTLGANWVVAVPTCVVSLVWAGWLVWRAVVRDRRLG